MNRPTKAEAAVKVLVDHLLDEELPPEAEKARAFLIGWLAKRQEKRKAVEAYWRQAQVIEGLLPPLCLSTPIKDMNLSVRSTNVLMAAGFKTAADVVAAPELLRTIQKKPLREINDALAKIMAIEV